MYLKQLTYLYTFYFQYGSITVHGLARVQIRGPRSLFTMKRRNDTYDVTHFT